MEPFYADEVTSDEPNPPPPAMSSTGLSWMIGMTIYAIAFGGAANRVVPGGPVFLNLADVLPVVASVGAMWIGISSFRTQQLPMKLLAITSMVVCCFAIINVVTDVMWFGIRPSARSDLIGF